MNPVFIGLIPNSEKIIFRFYLAIRGPLFRARVYGQREAKFPSKIVI